MKHIGFGATVVFAGMMTVLAANCTGSPDCTSDSECASGSYCHETLGVCFQRDVDAGVDAGAEQASAVYFAANFEGEVGFTPALRDATIPLGPSYPWTFGILLRPQSTRGANGDGGGTAFYLKDASYTAGVSAYLGGHAGTGIDLPETGFAKVERGSIPFDGSYVWIFLTSTGSGGTSTIYTGVEGGPLKHHGNSIAPSFAPAVLGIARDDTSASENGQGWPGHVAVVLLWNRVLTQPELEAQHGQVRGLQRTHLIREWLMTDVATVGTDTSGHSGHALRFGPDFAAATVVPSLPVEAGE